MTQSLRRSKSRGVKNSSLDSARTYICTPLAHARFRTLGKTGCLFHPTRACSMAQPSVSVAVRFRFGCCHLHRQIDALSGLFVSLQDSRGQASRDLVVRRRSQLSSSPLDQRWPPWRLAPLRPSSRSLGSPCRKSHLQVHTIHRSRVAGGVRGLHRSHPSETATTTSVTLCWLLACAGCGEGRRKAGSFSLTDRSQSNPGLLSFEDRPAFTASCQDG